MKHPYIYKITKKDTGQFYIGSQCRGLEIGKNYFTSVRSNKNFWLKKEKIKYKYQFVFPGLKDKKNLFYDFFLKEKNLLIEYNGKQHYDKKSFGKTYKEFLLQKHHDWLKRNYAKKMVSLCWLFHIGTLII